MTKMIVEATRLVPISALDHDDKQDGRDLVQGTYVVEVDEGSHDSQVEAALDIFHSSVPVACLEHYDFDVRKATPEDEGRDDLIEVEPFDLGQSMMDQFDDHLLRNCEAAYAEARKAYLSFVDPRRTDDTGKLCRWLAQNSDEAYSIFARHSDARGMEDDLLKISGMFHSIHHALVDDGEMTFVVADFYGPRIIFGDYRDPSDSDELQEVFRRDLDVTRNAPNAGKLVSTIDSVDAFIAAHEEFQARQKRRRDALEEKIAAHRNRKAEAEKN
jgi:hypothetical protein